MRDRAGRAVSARARAVLLWLSRQQRLQHVTAELGPARRMARRFVAGETRADALATVERLRRDGPLATVAFLGEHSSRVEEARAAGEECRALLRDLAGRGLEPNCSLKLTQLGLLVDAALAEEELRQVLAVADEVGGFVRIDMEGSNLTEATLEMYRRVTRERAGARRLGVVIQAYLHRSEADVRGLIEQGAPVRLVKGAYAEPPSIAFAVKADVDASYLHLVDLLLSRPALEAGVYPAFATHDASIIAAVRAMVRQRGVDAGQYEFQMLLGIRRDLQLRLVREGVRVRVYVPYGEQWYPYFMRRLAERPANVGFLLRNLIRT
jgi:proline dehydrogenase